MDMDNSLANNLGSRFSSSLPQDPDSLRKFLGTLTALRPGISAASARFGAVLLGRVLDRLEEKLDTPSVQLSELTRQACEAFITSADSVIVELERIAAQQVIEQEEAEARREAVPS